MCFFKDTGGRQTIKIGSHIHVSIAICTQVSFYILLDVCWKQLAGDEDDAF